MPSNAVLRWLAAQEPLSVFVTVILPFDEPSAREFSKILAGRRATGRPMSQFDAMIAAIARSHGATVATRNIGDFEHCGIRLVNPWDV